MRPTKLLIFGNPKAGTPVMLAAPRSAIDLPLKLLVWEDEQGKVWISYNSLSYFGDRHGLPPELLANLAMVVGSLEDGQLLTINALGQTSVTVGAAVGVAFLRPTPVADA